MRSILYLLFFCLFINSPVFSDEKLYFYSKDGDKLGSTLPQGYCDFTNTNDGKDALKYLKKTLHNQVLEPKIVYSLCNSDGMHYPWGYVAIFKDKLPITFTQKELFDLSIEGFQNTVLTDTIIKDINQNHENFETKVKVNNLGKFNILWNDENALIFYTTSKASSYGKSITEVITGSIFLHNQYAYYNYIVEQLNENNPLKVAQYLLNSAKATKLQK